MNQLEDIIDNYLISKEPYALQIDGGWGIGKTYYLKNIIKKNLVERNNYVIYFSVYGFDSLIQLKKEILFSIVSEVHQYKKIVSELSKVNKGLNAFLNKVGNNKLQSIGLLSDAILELLAQNQTKKTFPTNLIVIIDDLERISKKIDISDFLGFLSNEILGKLNCKVIMLSNSSEMSESDQFLKVKEKTIYRTFKFSYSISLIKKMILKESRNEFIQKNANWICSILSIEEEAINIRTLMSVIDNFSIVNNKLSKQIETLTEENNRTRIRKSLFLNIYVITSEYKSARIKDSNINLLDKLVMTNKYFQEYYNEHDDLISKILTRYHGKNPDFDNFIFYSEDVNNFVVFGYLSDTYYVRNWTHKFLPINSEKPEEKVSLLWNFRKMSDEEFKELQKQILVDIKEDKYDLEMLITVYAHFDKFSKLDLIFLKGNYIKLIEEKICKEYEKSARIEKTTVEEKIVLNPQIDIKGKNQELFLKLKEIDRKLNKQRLVEFIDCVFVNNKLKLQNAKDSIYNLKSELIKQMLEEDTVSKYIVKENNNADNLSELFDSKFYLVYEDVESLKAFISSIEKSLENKRLGRIDTYKVKCLIDSLNKLLKNSQ